MVAKRLKWVSVTYDQKTYKECFVIEDDVSDQEIQMKQQKTIKTIIPTRGVEGPVSTRCVDTTYKKKTLFFFEVYILRLSFGR